MSEVTAQAQPDTTPGAETPAEPPATVPGWRASLRFGLWTWLGGVLAYTLVTFVAWLPFEQSRTAPRTFAGVLDNWHRWDTTWYLIIAQYGYRFDSRSAAFFPLYPILIKGVDAVLPGDAMLAALVVSLAACYATLVMVHRFVTVTLGAELAARTAFYLLAFPTGFYLAAAYNESLFIALTVGAFLAMRRGHWWLAGALAALASATRLAGALLVVVYAFEYLRQRGFSLRRVRLDALGIVLAPLGLVAFAAYCWRVFHDPLYFERAQSVWFRSGFSWPWTTAGQVLTLIANSPSVLEPATVRNIINLGTAVGVLVMLYLALNGRWRLGADLHFVVLFAALDIMLPLVSPIHADYPLSSVWRFALECLPVFIVLAKMGRDTRFDRLYLLAALPVQGVMILTFIQNQFVA